MLFSYRGLIGVIFMKNKGKIFTYILFGISITFMVVVGYEYYHNYFYTLKDPKAIKNIINSYGRYGIFIFFILQIMQVIAFFIPGEIFQIAGGYIYGTLAGAGISLLGITLGSSITFYLSNICGKSFVKKLVSNDKFFFIERTLKAGSKNYVVFFIYLIPGMPKDIMGYICGVSNISYKNFIIYSTIGRIPAILVSAYFGAKITPNNILLLATIGGVMTFLFFVGIFKGEKLMKNVMKKVR